MDWKNFFYRNGYGIYVWGSYGIALIAMGGEVILLRLRRRALQERPSPTASKDVEHQQAGLASKTVT